MNDRYERSEMSIVFRLPASSGRLELRCAGVDDLSITGIRMSNIIDHAEVFDQSAEEDALSRSGALLFEVMRGRPPAGKDLEWAPLVERLAMIRSGVMKFLVLHPVHGATTFVLARGITLTPLLA